MAKSYSKNVFSFVRNRHTVFQSGCSILYSRQRRMRVSMAPHPRQHLVMSVFWILAHSNRCVVPSPCFNLHFPKDI